MLHLIQSFMGTKVLITLETVLGLILTDFIFGVLVSLRNGNFNFSKLPQFVETSLVPYIGGLLGFVTHIYREGKISCNVGRVKEETIKSLFIRVYNRLYNDQAKLLREYRQRLEREKLTELDNERIAELDEEIEKLIKQDSRVARTLELETILESQSGAILEFREDLYRSIIEKIVVKERTCLELHLKNGLRFEEHYTLKRGRDLF